MLTLYGIPNCDTVKKARRWLDTHGVAYVFHDYRKAGVPEAFDAWVAMLGWEALVNRSGTTFRKLSPEETSGLDTARAVALMRAYPSVIRRPVLTDGETPIVGFDAERYAARFGEFASPAAV